MGESSSVTIPNPFDQLQHINHALVAKTYAGMYNLHKYWARKPANVINEYINTYSKPEEIILDPFVGSGTTALEALRLSRKAVAIDLNPTAVFITKMTAINIDIGKLDKYFQEIKKKVKSKINGLYALPCPKCGNNSLIVCTVWEKDRPRKVWYECKRCSSKNLQREGNEKDKNLAESFEKVNLSYWYPKDRIFSGAETQRLLNGGLQYFHELFTKRTLLGLSILFNEIKNIPENIYKEMFAFVFTSSLAQLTKMISPNVEDSLGGGVGWIVHSYWLPPSFKELNVWRYFESRYQKIRAGKIESNKAFKCKLVKDFNELLTDRGNLLLKKYSALEIGDVLPNESVDYIFTDPPYGGSIQYFELSTLWSTWLKGIDENEYSLNYPDEITVNKYQKKDFNYYHRMLSATFSQMNKILKPNKYLHVTFHHTDIKIWNSVIRAVVGASFDLEKIVYQPPSTVSAKAQNQPYGSAKGDYYLRFRKPKTVKISDEGFDTKRYEKVVIESAKRIIAERGEPTAYTYILNGIIPSLQKEGLLLGSTLGIDEVLRKVEGKEFILKDQKWWLKNPSEVPYLEKVPLAERVEKAVYELLQNRIKVSFDEVLQSVFVKFPNARTPDTSDIRKILAEYAQKTSDGKWRLLPEEQILKSRHNEIIYFLTELGSTQGFLVSCSHPEINFEGKRITDLKGYLNATQLEKIIKDIPKENLEKIFEVDVLWIKGNKIVFDFEVENTSSITDSLVRGANIPYNCQKFIIMPQEREKLLLSKTNEPALKQYFGVNGWQIIYYGALEKINKKNFSLEQFNLLVNVKSQQPSAGQQKLELQ